jgi:hypothetical protein
MSPHQPDEGPFDDTESAGHEHTEPAPNLMDYPELQPVLAMAMDAIVSSFYPEKIGTDFRAYLERVTEAAMAAIYAPVAATAARTAQRTDHLRAARTASVARAAEEMAAHVAETAAALKAQDDAAAATVATAAEAEDMALELETLESASAIRATALETCYRFAVTFGTAAAEAVLSDGMPE